MPGSSYVDHWLLGGWRRSPTPPGSHSTASARERKPERHHRTPPPVGCHCSVLRELPRSRLRRPHGRCRGRLSVSFLRAVRRHRFVVRVRGLPVGRAGVEPFGFRRLTRPRPSLENCRASTSIFERNSASELPSYEEPTVDALAPDADEGRGWLRKATGSCRPSFDPRISEWGNPAGVMPSHPYLNKIG
jgi:hypothetical protein